MDIDHSTLLTEFIAITKCPSAKAIEILSSNEWNLEASVEHFYTLPSIPQPTNPSKSSSRIKTFAELAKDASDDDDDDQRMYAGGEKSGLAVNEPGKKKTAGRELVEGILEQAARGGEGRSEEIETAQKWSGKGQRLGSEAVEPTIADRARAANIADQVVEPAPVVSRLLTFWADGFSVEDGPLLKYEDPKNRDFLSAIKSGRAPIDLLGVLPNQPVEVKVAHRMQEAYVAPPVKPMSAFSGQGQRLGSIVPAGSATASIPGSFPVSPAPVIPSIVKPTSAPLNVDATLDVTSIQVRLADGTRMVARFNSDVHTLADLRRFVGSARSQGRAFLLQTAMPTRVLVKDEETLREAGLLNAVVIQRFV